MLYQGHLFDKTITVEREMTNGSIIQLTIRPTTKNEVEILEYYKKSSKQDVFKRQANEEKKIVEFNKLGLEQSFEFLFG